MNNQSENEQEHFALSGKNLGPCRELVGNIYVLLFFVNTPLHPWPEAKRDEAIRKSWSSIDFMKKEAVRYGASVDMKVGWFEYNLPFEHDKDQKWYHTIMHDYFHSESMADLVKYYEGSLHVDNAAIVFLFNSSGRSYCYMSTKEYPYWKEEFDVIYCETDFHDNFLTHELLHLFGAMDLYDYQNEGVQAIAEQFFPDSVMLRVSHVIDELTAYLIGWTKQPSPKVLQFLARTKGLRGKR